MGSRSIFITGAASGIGAATARLFASRGWLVGACDINHDALQVLAAELGGDSCAVYEADVRQGDELRTAVDSFAELADGRLDALFNCAGVLSMGRNQEIPLADQRRILDVNLGGVLSATAAALPWLQKTSGSRIITMSSASALYGIPELAVYSATKAAVRSLTESLNLELADSGVWVCDITVDYVDTPMISEAEVKAASVKKMGVGTSAGQVAQMVLRATMANRLHWSLGAKLKLLIFAFWLLPFARRFLVKTLAM